MKTPLTAIKAAILSSSLLFIYVFVFENVGEIIIPLYFLSIVITFLIAGGMIFFTIMPFSLLEKDNTILFKKYFPFYAIVFFCSCLSFAYIAKFENIVVGVLSIAYITAMQSWIWTFKPENK